MTPYEALYGRLCKSPICWAEPENNLLLGPDIIKETTNKILMIQDYILTAQSRQTSYADKRRRPLEIEVGLGDA